MLTQYRYPALAVCKSTPRRTGACSFWNLDVSPRQTVTGLAFPSQSQGVVCCTQDKCYATIPHCMNSGFSFYTGSPSLSQAPKSLPTGLQSLTNMLHKTLFPTYTFVWLNLDSKSFKGAMWNEWRYGHTYNLKLKPTLPQHYQQNVFWHYVKDIYVLCCRDTVSTEVSMLTCPVLQRHVFLEAIVRLYSPKTNISFIALLTYCKTNKIKLTKTVLRSISDVWLK